MRGFHLLRMFIIIDGIDGSGKSTILETWAADLAAAGKKIFSLKSYWRERHTHPTADELMDYDVILSAEPTSVWIGSAIREEMIRRGTTYTGRDIAEAYALDRLVLYQRLIVPLRQAGKIILQDRGVSTSLCYQPLQDDRLSGDLVASIPGNAFALAHAPEYLVIADTPADMAMQRLGRRQDKQDTAIFEQADFLTQARDRFLSPEYQKYFTDRGTTVRVLNSHTSLDIMKQNATQFITSLSIT